MVQIKNYGNWEWTNISIREDTDDSFLYTILSQDSISIILQSAINLHNLEVLDAKLKKIINKPKPPGLKEWIDFHDEKKKLNPEHDELTYIYTKEQTEMFFPSIDLRVVLKNRFRFFQFNYIITI
jgi:hypothetical protein